jgi:uncharacterized repeat protein (TIGR01451 family)
MRSLRVRRLVLLAGFLLVVACLVALLCSSLALASPAVGSGVWIAKAAQPRQADPGDVITYTVTLSNPMGSASPTLLVTDTLPTQTSFGKLLSKGQGEYDANLRAVLWSGSLPPGGSREISFTVAIATNDITNTLITNEVFLDDGQQISRAWDWTLVGGLRVYLPLTLRNHPVPAPPILDEIQAPGIQSSFQVNWGAVPGAVSYLLQQDSAPDFPAPSDVYSGVGTSHVVESRGIQTLYYRVKAFNPSAGGDWSSTRSVSVYWESEPNDPWEIRANGPLVSGSTHYGYQNDQKDFFWFDAGGSGTIRLTLTNPSATGVQLQLLSKQGDSLTLIKYRASPPYGIEYTGSAGRYYVYIFATGGYNESQPYSLWVEYPQ